MSDILPDMRPIPVKRALDCRKAPGSGMLPICDQADGGDLPFLIRQIAGEYAVMGLTMPAVHIKGTQMTRLKPTAMEITFRLSRKTNSALEC